MTRCTAAIALALFTLLPSSARADEVWVDSVHGDDTNGGTGPNDAWATITHALGQLGPVPGVGLDIVHVLRGEYSLVTGETFPLVLRDRVRLVGEEGPASTRILGGLEIGLGSAPTGPRTGAEGFTFIGADHALRMESLLPNGPLREATFRDLVFEGCGIGALVVSDGSTSAGSSFVLEDSLVRGCHSSFWFMSRDASRLTATLRGVRIEGYSDQRLVAFANGGAQLDFVFERSSIRLQSQYTIAAHVHGASSGGLLRAVFRDSEITARGAAGTAIRLDAPARIERCTIAGHIRGVQQVGMHPTAIVDSIVYGNSIDLSTPAGAPVLVRDCDIEHPLHTGQNGNFSAPPLFVHPETGNYDLRLGSPCLDRLPPSGAPDLFGRPRDVDGDLDTVAARDVGAIEMRTLDGPERARLGEPVVFSMHGPEGETAWLAVSRERPLVAPLATPFGGLALQPGTAQVVALVQTAGGVREAVLLNAPASAMLVGTTIGYQALVRVPGAPAGAVYTNAVGLTLEP